MITKLSDPRNGFETWRRFLGEWEPAHRGRYRAMLMQLLQFSFTGDRRQASLGTQPTGSRMAHARWTERGEGARVRCSPS